MRYLIEWVYPVLPVSPPPPRTSVVDPGDSVSIVERPTGGADVEFIDVTGPTPQKVTGYVDGKSGSYLGDFPHAAGHRYAFSASVSRGYISGMIFRYGPAEDSGGHWGGR